MLSFFCCDKVLALPFMILIKKYSSIMSIKSSINKVAIQHTCIVFFFIFLIITKIKRWPVFKQDPLYDFLNLF